MIKKYSLVSVYLVIFLIVCKAFSFAQVVVGGAESDKMIQTPKITSSTKVVVRGVESDKTIQNPKTAVGKALYNFSHVKDTAHRDYSYKEIFELAYAANASYFSSFTAQKNDSIMKSQTAAAFQNAPDPDHVDITLTGVASSPEKFYTEKDNSISVYEIKSLVGSSFIIKSSQPKINWQIIDSTKTIQGYICQKAIGESYGRKYTAWFCTDLPYPFGPRRLNGLPGHILEAYDDQKEVVYELNRVENFNTNIAPIGLPLYAENTSYTAFNKAEAAYKKNPQAFINAGIKKRAGAPKPKSSSPMDGFDVSKIKSISVKKINPDPKYIIANNPIDLTTAQ